MGNLNPDQWEDIERVLAIPEIKGLVVATETPFVYLSPAEVSTCDVIASAEFRKNPHSMAALEWQETVDLIKKVLYLLLGNLHMRVVNA